MKKNKRYSWECGLCKCWSYKDFELCQQTTKLPGPTTKGRRILDENINFMNLSSLCLSCACQHDIDYLPGTDRKTCVEDKSKHSALGKFYFPETGGCRCYGSVKHLHRRSGETNQLDCYLSQKMIRLDMRHWWYLNGYNWNVKKKYRREAGIITAMVRNALQKGEIYWEAQTQLCNLYCVALMRLEWMNRFCFEMYELTNLQLNLTDGSKWTNLWLAIIKNRAAFMMQCHSYERSAIAGSGDETSFSRQSSIIASNQNVFRKRKFRRTGGFLYVCRFRKGR